MSTPLLRRSALAAYWLGLATALHAQTGTPEYDPLGEFDQLPKQVRVQVEFIEVSHELYTELMAPAATSANDSALRARLGGLVKEGKATVVETMMAIAKSAQKGTSEAIEEFIYPTEYEPPKMPARVTDGADKNDAGTPAPELAAGPAPSAWDTRNTGSTLEIEPNICDNEKFIDLRFVPEIVYHVGNHIWMEWQDSHGTAHVQMPTFYTARVNTSLTLVTGQPTLAAALSPKNEAGHVDPSRKLMVFVKADILTVGR